MTNQPTLAATQCALPLIGFQNDYFSSTGILHGVIEACSRVTGVLENTLNLIKSARHEFGLMVSTPIIFTSDYHELHEPVGILKTIKEVGAFRANSAGAEVIDELKPFSEDIVELQGKRGLNAFSNTQLEQVLKARGITHVIFAGTVTSICIDSTAREAFEKGFKVTILADCTSSRTEVEQEFYCGEIFPLYAQVMTHLDLLARFGAGSVRSKLS